MFLRLLFMFIAVPLVELVILLQVADATSWQFTLLLVIITGTVGTWLARSQGLLALRRIQQSLDRGELPTNAILDSALILVAGALLLTPGILTDLVGLALLFPPTRTIAKRSMLAWVKRHVRVATFVQAGGTQQAHSSHRPPAPDNVVESYVVDSYVVDAPVVDGPSDDETTWGHGAAD